MKPIIVTSKAFEEGKSIPRQYTGRGENISPDFQLTGIVKEAKSIVIIMDDVDHPIVPHYNHWIIWNIPVSEEIPAHIPAGETVASLGNAKQGMAYGKHQYKGPKPPFSWKHRYTFSIYLLDGMLSLPSSARKKEVMQAMEGHILQEGAISGVFQSHG